MNEKHLTPPGKQKPTSAHNQTLEQTKEVGIKEAVADSVISSPQIALELLRVARCPECDGSGSIAVQTGQREYVTRDMAHDAGDPSMEGSLYSDEQWEQRQCEWCYQREVILSENPNEVLPHPLSKTPASLEQTEARPETASGEADLDGLREFLINLYAHGSIHWNFDEQQADPINKFWREEVPKWLSRLPSSLPPTGEQEEEKTDSGDKGSNP